MYYPVLPSSMGLPFTKRTDYHLSYTDNKRIEYEKENSFDRQNGKREFRKRVMIWKSERGRCEEGRGEGGGEGGEGGDGEGGRREGGEGGRKLSNVQISIKR